MSTARIGGVAGQWLKGQLQPSAQHPPEGSCDLCFSVAALPDRAIALAQDSLMPFTDIAAFIPCDAEGVAWACNGDDIVTKTNISAIAMRVQGFAIAAI